MIKGLVKGYLVVLGIKKYQEYKEYKNLERFRIG